VTSRADGATVEATLDQSGPVGMLIGLLTRGLTRRYLATELDRLRDTCEHGASGRSL
jgi:hypothetical protein